MDPYRGASQVGTCPRCGNPTESDGEVGRLVCVRGCGEWYPRLAFEREWANIIVGLAMWVPTSWPWEPAKCPDCESAMAVAYRAEVRYDYCPAHGVWLDAGEYERFATLFARS